ncbi:MAG: zinc-dependent alcohol dehydrogenase family protein [Verrucomicrobiota bacterium]|nr:zinc-dependent alcohol dehydrogenase family protein [Verrucomicrobiota bacterium]
MKAMVLKAHGGTDGFALEEFPNPEVCSGHLLLKVSASSVNPVDYKIRQGLLPVGPELPGVLHGDVSGTVLEVGDEVRGFEVGEEVYGCVGGFKGMPGVLSEYALADARLVSKKPHNLTMEQAATLPLVGITAWNALIDRAKVAPGQRVLVHAACGGVGQVGIQLAKALGAEVHSTASKLQKMDYGYGLGADRMINYKETEVDAYVSDQTGGIGYDVVFDTVGGKCLDDSFRAARTGGTVVSIAARSSHDLTPVHLKSLTLHVVFMLLPMIANQGRESHGDILREIRKWVEQEKITPLLHEEVFDFQEVGKAHEVLESGGALGKIALRANW